MEAEDNSVEFILSFHCRSWRFNKGHQALSPAEQFALGVRVTMFLKMTQGNTLQKERVPVCIYIHRITRLHTILGLVI